MKLLLCFGTRPEAIKMAPVLHELKKKKINFKVCVTAQHREMLDQVLNFFEIEPDYDLNLMKAGQSLNSLSAAIFTKFDVVLKEMEPDLVLVHGDTTTASMIAQAAFHRQVKVGHVEAGLRTFNKLSPFPEEINRQLIGKIADIHFAPTSKARLNLLKEQIAEEQIVLTGNTVVDALHWAQKKLAGKTMSPETSEIESLLRPEKQLILVTGHRRENFGKGIEELGSALLELSLKPEVEIIYPVHLNPNVKEPIKKRLSNIENVHLVPPVSYPAMLWLMQRAAVIISDSGGIQEEAPAFGKPVLVTRVVSERMEGVEAGFAVLVGTNREKIIKESIRLLQNPFDLRERRNPYGDGRAAERIVRFLKDWN